MDFVVKKSHVAAVIINFHALLKILNGGTKIAYYQQKDWERFLEAIDDREKMPETWEEWHKEF